MDASASHNKDVSSVDLCRPLALYPRNFTSLNRTPWAGNELARGIKSGVVSDHHQLIGESWEVSCDPDSPSKLLVNPQITLSDVITHRPIECLSQAVVQSGRSHCDILVKLLNAASPLSLQIHPRDDNPLLSPRECGKPESWLILSAQPGAGLYLGFSEALTHKEIEARLTNGTFTPNLLQFVPVAAGDYFEIEPHVPHAIGPGLTLLEPQRLVPGRSGKTWRLWDWNRKYNSHGELDEIQGTPRPLHICESLPLLDPEHQWGTRYVDSLRRSCMVINKDHGVQIRIYPANDWYQTILIHMPPSAQLYLSEQLNYGCLTVLAGNLESQSLNNQSRSQPLNPHTQSLEQGTSYFLPAACLPTKITTSLTAATLTLIRPAGASLKTIDPTLFFQ